MGFAAPSSFGIFEKECGPAVGAACMVGGGLRLRARAWGVKKVEVGGWNRGQDRGVCGAWHVVSHAGPGAGGGGGTRIKGRVAMSAEHGARAGGRRQLPGGMYFHYRFPP